ncbi:MAG: rod shape-determining protein MreD [Gammaproteobacteria bacterium]|nr:rod shape-determining protein MreD [Gammaproteobacteria bacterium]
MTFVRRSGGSIITLSFVIALMSVMMPLPDFLSLFRPELVTMVLIYWCIDLPGRVGVGIGWVAGLMLDVVQGALLGQHAFALAIVAWLTLKLHQRIRVYPKWQQALSVLVLIVLSQMIVLWVQGTIGKSPNTWMYWLPSITSMLIWPWLSTFMRNVRKAYKVS